MQLPTWNVFSSPPMTRTTATIALIALTTVLTIAGAGYYSYQTFFAPPHVPGPGLHRSNAIHRRRRSRGRSGEVHEVDENSHEPSALPDALRALRERLPVPEADVADDWWNELGATPLPQRAGQNIVSLLFRVSEDNARRNACVHRGCACNACGTVPIRGIRYRCANCADFDLCETCEAQGLHNKTHIFYKVKVPAPPFGPRSMQPVWYPGDPEQCLRTLPKALIPKLSKDTGFERPELDAFWEQWTYMANTEWRDDPDELTLAMDRKTFERCLAPSGGYKHAAPNLIHDRMFAFYDTNHDGLISFTEFLLGLSYRKRKDKLRRIFEGYDIDGDGYVNRRDFLRMFRAYYVLYKQMHRDILEGLDDQVMSSTEAQQLVTSRQPLSGLFGRESRVPNGDLRRHVEGKVMDLSGEVHINDGRAQAVNEDTQDTAPRDEILSGLFSREPPRTHTLTYELTSSRTRRDSNPNYWEGLIDTPRQVSELPPLLIGESSHFRDLISQFTAATIEAGGSNSASSRSSDEENHDTRLSSNEHAAGGAHDINRTSGDALTTNGVSTNGESHAEGGGDVAGNNENEPVTAESEPTRTTEQEWSELRTEADIRERLNKADRKRRAAARRQLHERWKRRQFYLDEEEGGRAPDDWESDEDVLEARNHDAEDSGAGESSKSAQRPTLSPRSRSSSKVRFAEDTCTDDYEIRSNPSTSSRSVPERWGGFDISEAERDAGKEILYQVTQQAFNELLDVIFKEKEDMAVRCAETKREREIWRPLSSTIDLKDEDTNLKAASQENGHDEDGHGRKHNHRHSHHQNLTENGTSGSEEYVEDPFTDGHGHPEEQSLEELLSVSGYTVSLPDDEGANVADVELVEERVTHHLSSNEEALANGRVALTNPSFETEPIYRDPTLPQFRPNSIAESRPQAHFAERAVVVSPDSGETTIALPPPDPLSSPLQPEVESPILPSEGNDSDSEQHLETNNKPNSSAFSRRKKNESKDTKGKDKKNKGKRPLKWYDMSSPPERTTLVEYRRLDRAEEEQKVRGGWGKLNFDEFDKIYKKQEMNGNRLDYLGSWIDFCIP